jgi:hypothetical protein
MNPDLPWLLAGAAGAAGVLAVALRAAVRARHATARRASLLVAGLAAAVAAVVLVAALIGDRSPTRFYDGEGNRVRPWVRDPDLGSIYAPGSRLRAVKQQDGRTLYDATYTIDRFGHRVAPPPVAPGRPAVVFFGCSYTFGDGIEDQQSLPWQFAVATRREFDVVNAGHSGHGAHQVLRMLESGHLDERLRHGVAHAFYSAMDHHPARAAGLAPWDFHGPRYEIDGEGVAWRGPFHGPAGGLLLRLGQSLFGARWLPPWKDRPLDPAVDDERWARLVERSARLVREHWNATLTTIVWDPNSERGDRLRQLLVDRGLDVLPVSSVLPTGKGPPDLIPGDWHPTPATNALLARAIAERWFPEATRAEAGPAGNPAPPGESAPAPARSPGAGAGLTPAATAGP